MTAHRDPAAQLAALLDGLEAELLAAPDEEVEAALRETGRARAVALREARAPLVPDPRAAGADEPGSTPGVAADVAPVHERTRRH